MTGEVLQQVSLGFQWPTIDPFLFCVHHDDRYPAGNDLFGPAASLGGRQIGADFSGQDGWSMYHGNVVPGFPQHPHRGFETVTFVRRGLIDHADSMGAAARYGRGDVQWLTAGSGIVHAEMFPLLDPASPNPVELFQIWLNLPSDDKMVDPYFTMLWADDIQTAVFGDDGGRETRVTMVAGALPGHVAPAPPPNSWAARRDTDLAIWRIELSPGASWECPAAAGSETVRTLYVFDGDGCTVAGQAVSNRTGVVVDPTSPVTLTGGPVTTEILLLQGKPIGEPVAQSGPFVMNTEHELRQAYEDYRRTGFGGWPWPADDPVHGRDPARFAKHADGRTEQRTA